MKYKIYLRGSNASVGEIEAETRDAAMDWATTMYKYSGPVARIVEVRKITYVPKNKKKRNERVPGRAVTYGERRKQECDWASRRARREHDSNPMRIGGIDFGAYKPEVSKNERLKGLWGARLRYTGTAIAKVFEFLLEHPRERFDFPILADKVTARDDSRTVSRKSISSSLMALRAQGLVDSNIGVWRLRINEF